MARLDKEQWAIIRERWESDPRTGYVWIVAELSLAVGDKAVLQRANREGWSKKIVTEVVTEVTKEPIREQNPVGRPTKFREEYINQAFRLSLLGCTDAEMAEVFGIAERNFQEWKVRYPEFHQSIKNGKTPADAVVATSLYDRARGYAHEDVHISNFQGQITVTPITKHYPPDFQSASLWLRNRQPEKWRKDRHFKDPVTTQFPDEALLDSVRAKRLAEAREKENERRGLREKLGIDIAGLMVGSDEI